MTPKREIFFKKRFNPFKYIDSQILKIDPSCSNKRGRGGCSQVFGLKIVKLSILIFLNQKYKKIALPYNFNRVLKQFWERKKQTFETQQTYLKK